MKKYKILNLTASSFALGINIIGHLCLASNTDENIFSQDNKTKYYEPVRDEKFPILQIPNFVKKEFEDFIKIETLNLDIYKDSILAMQKMGNKLREILPKEMKEIFTKMGKTGEPSILHLKGLPTDLNIPTEGDILQRVNQKGRVSESIILGLADIMNCEARANPKEQGGRIIHNVAPVKGFEKTPSSRGTEPLYLHTEEAFEDSPPDFLILYGLIGDPKAGTAYYFIEDFLDSFSEEIIQEMKKPHFNIKSNAGGLDQSSEGIFSLITIEEKEKQANKLRLRLYGNMEDVTAVTDESKGVIEYINNFFRSVKPHSISLDSGEALIFNNGWGIDKINGVMHGRKGAIENHLRWLQRAFLFRNNSK